MQYPARRQDLASPSAPRFDGTQACAGADINLFFPPAGAQAVANVRAAKALCASCHFLRPCLEYALASQGTPGVYVAGVWGGTTQAERTRCRRSVRRTAVAA